MKLLTDEIIHDQLIKSGTMSVNLSYVFFAICVICIVIMVGLLRRKKKKEEEGEFLTKNQKQAFLVPLMLAVFFGFFFGAMFCNGKKNIKAADDFIVSKDYVVSKDKQTKVTRKSKGRRSTTTYYYLYFAEYGKKSVGQQEYNRTNKNDEFYLVISDHSIMKMYSAKEYKYEGELK